MKHSALTVLGLLTLSASAAHAQGWCANADLSGSYAVLLTGSFINVPGVEIKGPIARVALVNFDGSGNLNVPFERGIYAGIPATQPFSGTYAVAPDCGFQAVVVPPPPIDFPVPFAGALSDNRRRISVMLVGPGAVVSGEFERMAINGCTNRTLEGGFSMSLDGTVLAPASAAGPYKASGRMVFDGAGGVRASGASTTNGNVSPMLFSGSYTITNQCSLSIDYKVADVSYKFEGMVSDTGKKVLLIQTAPVGTSVITGVLTNQAGRAAGF